MASPQYVAVADVDSLPPGKGRTVCVSGRCYAVWNVEGSYYCVDDECPHRGGPLGAGHLEGCEVFCPLHGWGFDVRTGQCASRPDRPVKTYAARVRNGQVEIEV